MARLILGTMNFGGRTTRAESLAILERAFERGLYEIDTANMYSDGESEVIVGEVVRGRREQVKLTSKVGIGSLAGPAEGLSATRIHQALDESLRRLQTDYLDSYLLHTPDQKTPIDETVGAIGQELERGRIRSFGVSNYGAWRALEVVLACDRAGISRPKHGQVLYNLVLREVELEYLAFAANYGLATQIYNPLAGGLLTGRYAGTDKAPAGSRIGDSARYKKRYWSERMLSFAAELELLAKERGLSSAALAYGWAASKKAIDAVVLGPADVGQLDAALDAFAKPLDRELLSEVERRSARFRGTDGSYAR